MITDYDVYVAFRKAQAFSKNKPYRLPKNWDVFKNSRLSDKNLQFLQTITDYFNTKWSNISIDKYMECGFELFKNFSYHQFLKRNVIDLYIEKDKIRKRIIKQKKSDIRKSFEHIKSLNLSPIKNYSVLETYCKLKDNQQKKIIKDYLLNKIDPVLFVYCLYYKFFQLTDIEKELVYNITNNYRKYLVIMFKQKKFIEELSF